MSLVRKAIRRLPKRCTHIGWFDKVQHRDLRVTLTGKDRVTWAEVTCQVCGQSAEAKESRVLIWLRKVGNVALASFSVLGFVALALLFGAALHGCVGDLCCRGCQ